jgi:hypothetical protein
MTAYAGCTAASKSWYTKERWRSSTMTSESETSSAPSISAHAFATPSLTPFFSDTTNLTFPGKSPASTRVRSAVTYLVNEG